MLHCHYNIVKRPTSICEDSLLDFTQTKYFSVRMYLTQHFSLNLNGEPIVIQYHIIHKLNDR